MSRTRVALLALCWLIFACSASAWADPLTVQWLPGESYAGGKQYDARLNKTAKLWGAGMPLKQVFADLHAQTGVDLACYPAGDVNERVCINAYLNRENPPDLRSALVQISWVMDCAISYTGEGEERAYCLMSTSVGGEDVIAKLKKEDLARYEREAEEKRLPPEQVLKRREDLREALSLSREEAIERYKGKDDLLLFISLDPARRALAELYASLPVEFGKPDTAVLLSLQKLSNLSPQHRALYLEAVRQRAEAWAKKDPGSAETLKMTGDPADWLSALDPQVALYLWAGTERADVHGTVYLTQQDAQSGKRVMTLPLLVNLQVAGELMPWEQLEARRLAGDTFTKEEEKAFVAENWRQPETSNPNTEEAEARAQRVNLPEELEQRLASLPLLPDLQGSYTLWQIQEAVAKLTGLNVLSDCFWQSARDQRILYNDPGADREAPATALQVLKAATGRVGARGQIISNSFPDHPYGTAWEWQGAGRFLVFRSADRDAWRAGFFPIDALRVLDAWVEPSLPAEGKAAPTVTPDWHAFGRLISDLSTAQIKWGGLLAYEDPADFRNACRQSFRARILSVVGSGMGSPHVVRFLGSLSDDEWQRLSGEGLRVGSDISLDTLLDRFRARLHELPPPWVVTNEQGGEVMVSMTTAAGESGFAAGDILRVQEGKGNWFDASPGATFELQVLRQGKVKGRFLLPARVALRPGPTGSIALPKAAGE